MSTNKLSFFFTFIIIVLSGTLTAAAPDWITSIPYEEDAFLGVGSGFTSDEAQENARIDIVMQLSSKIDSTVLLSGDMTAENVKITEYTKAVVSSSSLRGSELVETWEAEGIHYALVRYCDSCGTILVSAALTSAVEVVNRQKEINADAEEAVEPIELDEIFEELKAPANSEAVKLQRSLQGPAVAIIPPPVEEEAVAPAEIDSESYSTDNIMVAVDKDKVIVRLINFPPNSGDMSENQIRDLQSLSDSLFLQLVEMGYSGVTIVGHANPEGKDTEEEELMVLSRQRAENLETFLRGAGIAIDEVQWKGGDELLGSTETTEGRALNRRVDIYVHF